MGRPTKAVLLALQARPEMMAGPVPRVAQQIAQHLRPDDAQPETAVGQIQTARTGQDMQHEHGQGQLEHIKTHGRAGILRQHVGHVDRSPHGYEQKDGKNSVECFHTTHPCGP